VNRAARTLAIAGFAVAASGCAAAPADPPAPPRPILLHVHFAGSIRCSTFPYSCGATLSIIGVEQPVDATKPAATDAQWFVPTMGATIFDPAPIGGAPSVLPGKHRLVMSMLGQYDTPSYDANGEIARDLLARCSADIEPTDGSGPIDVLVTFTPVGPDWDAICELQVTPS
jgi:hypothetical protein